MFFFLSQALDFVLLPSNIIALLGLGGCLALLLRCRRLGLATLAASSLLLAVGWSPIGISGLLVLEDRFAPPTLPTNISGVILLGGAVDTHIAADRGVAALNEAGERLTAVRTLAERFPGARIFISGGAGHAGGERPLTESAVARDLLIAMGVADSRIAMEERSRNTCENAIESLAAIKPQPVDRWLLVTSASHMPRAMGCFRAAGFDVIPYPVDFRSRGNADLFRPAASIAIGLSTADLAAHEWIGLATYRLMGMTQELFPAP